MTCHETVSGRIFSAWGLGLEVCCLRLGVGLGHFFIFFYFGNLSSVTQLPVTCSLNNVTCITYTDSLTVLLFFPVSNFGEIGLPYTTFSIPIFR